MFVFSHMIALYTEVPFRSTFFTICHLIYNIFNALFSAELARQERRRRKRRHRWVWGSIAAVITVGAGALAWSYLPAERSSSNDHYDAPEHDHETK